MNEQNLKPPFTPTTAREAGRKGGKASAKAKQRRALIRETLEIVLNQEIKDPETLETLKKLGYTGTPTYCDYLIVNIVTRTAEKGTMTDLVKLAQLLGETTEIEPATLNEAREILAAIPSVID